jgi:SagB-type dehydrogenase family enzyme
MEESVGDNFHQKTKYFRHTLGSGGLDWQQQPELYKTYPESTTITLPPIRSRLREPLDAILKKRRSIRSFSATPLSLDHLSYLLWASSGIQRSEQGFAYRTAPSAGALYPIETYLVVNNITNLQQGVYHYNIKQHLLEELKSGNFGSEISQAALDQDMCATAPVVFIWTAIFARSKWKYQQRAYRYIYLDAGHIAENLALAATGLNLGSCHIGALFDDEVNALIEVDGDTESVVYMTVVGHTR